MAVTQWISIGPGMTPGAPHPMPGVVVNGGSGGGGTAPVPESGRGYPR